MDKVFKCELKEKTGLVRETFYRVGESAGEIMATLSRYQWPKGDWHIKEDDEWDDVDEYEADDVDFIAEALR